MKGNTNIVVAALYQFAPLEELESFQAELLLAMRSAGVMGTILLAHEGINGTIAGSREGIDSVLVAIRSHPLLARLEHKESFAQEMPFRRPRVKLKQEIVSLGVPGVDPNRQVGRYVPPAEWNDLIQDPDVKLIDTRNRYEYAMGTFEGAVDPETDAFRDFPKWVEEHLDPERDSRVAMFCTGGIRCEKATSFLLSKGFKEVYHLQGGILKYLEEVPAEASRWNGECFVFDDRVGVGHGLEIGEHTLCRACRMPLSAHDQAHPAFEEGVSCAHCIGRTSEDDKARYRERERQMKLAEERGEVHLGAVLPGSGPGASCGL